MKVVVCGGRDYRLTMKDIEWLDAFHEKHRITMVISGQAGGADTDAEQWADLHRIPVDPYPVKKADWHQHGFSAGPIRNAKMASLADYVVAFPGGRGTRNMVKQARAKGIPVFLIGWEEEA